MDGESVTSMSMSHTFQYPTVSPVSSSPTSHSGLNGAAKAPSGPVPTPSPLSSGR
jgi:hypothetical protein